MKELYLFFKSEYKNVGFGWTLTFLSSFGQTFLISLYVPEILQLFTISNGVFGGIYAFATIIASIIMPTVGHNIDHKPVKKSNYVNHHRYGCFYTDFRIFAL